MELTYYFKRIAKPFHPKRTRSSPVISHHQHNDLVESKPQLKLSPPTLPELLPLFEEDFSLEYDKYLDHFEPDSTIILSSSLHSSLTNNTERPAHPIYGAIKLRKHHRRINLYALLDGIESTLTSDGRISSPSDPEMDQNSDDFTSFTEEIDVTTDYFFLTQGRSPSGSPLRTSLRNPITSPQSPPIDLPALIQPFPSGSNQTDHESITTTTSSSSSTVSDPLSRLPSFSSSTSHPDSAPHLPLTIITNNNPLPTIIMDLPTLTEEPTTTLTPIELNYPPLQKLPHHQPLTVEISPPLPPPPFHSANVDSWPQP